jgi:type III restriction enzyme
VGTYNPDWAVAYRNDRSLYFVAETKGAGQSQDPAHALLRLVESMKITCGERHFENFEHVRFKVVKQLSELIT